VAGEARALAALGDYFNALRLVEPWRAAAPAASVEVLVALAAGDVGRARDVARNWRLDGSVAGSVRRALARALVLDVAGNSREAVPPLWSALRLVAEHELIQPVVEGGAPIARLLRRVESRNGNDAIVRLARRAEALIATKGSAAPLFTAREAAVLARLEQGLSQPAIARDLFLSINTVKTYVKAIYRKLGATSRAEALAAWRETLPMRDPSR
jgi:DNA-binding CsgD family transcriptional regulator